MASVTFDITAVHGDTIAFDVTVGSLGASGLNAFTSMRFTAKKDLSDSDAAAVISRTLGSGITIKTIGNATTNGVLEVVLLPTNTQSLSAGYTYILYYDVRLYDASGNAYTVAQGNLTITPTATQATA